MRIKPISIVILADSMQKLRLLITLVCIVSMTGFEVVRDLSVFSKADSSDVVVLSFMNEEDQSDSEGQSGGMQFELDIDLMEFNDACFFKEIVRLEIFSAHDLSYQLLEQKVVLPPPELLIS